MKSLLLLCAVCLQIGWSYARGSNGVGAFSFQDSSGNRYGGTYGLKDGEVVDAKGEFPPEFAPPDFASRNDFSGPDFEEGDGFPDSGFFPEYFRNLENLLHDPFPFGGMFKPFIDFQQAQQNMNRAFQTNLENQRRAMNAARKAFELTSNRGIVPYLNPSRFTPFRELEFPPMPLPPQFPKGFPFSDTMPGFGKAGGSSAYAEAAAGPGVNYHRAFISPGNPLSPNVDETNAGSGMMGGFKEVSVSSFSSNIDGKTQQESKTFINDNGKISAFSVHNP